MEDKTKDLATTDSLHRSFPVWAFDDPFMRPLSLLGRSLMGSSPVEDITPHVDMFEDHGDLVLKAELPGIKKEDIEVKLSDGSIIISGEKKKEEEIKKQDYYKWERSYGSFCRMFALPSDVKRDKIKTTFKDGILEVRMPKSEESKSKEVKLKIQ